MGNGMCWNFGIELWCNQEGKYMHLVADIRHLSSPYEMSLCSLGIMGTKYERAEMQENFEVLKGETLTVRVPHIYSSIEIANELRIKVRQPAHAELAYVSLRELQDETEVFVNLSGYETGNKLQIVLEQYDSLSNVQSALKVENLTVTIVLPQVTENLGMH